MAIQWPQVEQVLGMVEVRMVCLPETLSGQGKKRAASAAPAARVAPKMAPAIHRSRSGGGVWCRVLTRSGLPRAE